MNIPRMLRIAAIGLSLVSVVGLHSAAAAEAGTYDYPATCTGSFSKQGKDVSKLPFAAITGSTPIQCDSLILSILDNGHALVQIIKTGTGLGPLGFAGDGLKDSIELNFVILPLSRIYLFNPGNPERPQSGLLTLRQSAESCHSPS
jgi:hypothetical protein